MQSEFLVPEGAQLQNIKSYRNAEGQWVYEFQFFPGPAGGVWVSAADSQAGISLRACPDSTERASLRSQFVARADPLQLYLRAHACNQRLTQALRPNVFEWCFQSVKFVLEWVPEAQSVLLRVAHTAHPNEFRRRVRLAPLVSEQTSRLALQPSAAGQHKDERTLKAVMNDIATNQEMLQTLTPLAEYFQSHPHAWGEVPEAEWPLEAQNALKFVQRKGQMPPLQAVYRAEALEKIFELRRKLHRKIEGAQKRWNVLQLKIEQGLPVSKARTRTNSFGLRGVTHKEADKPLGLNLNYHSRCWARVGRNQAENAELYRRASARDLWFHVRGLEGAHVWVPRGQSGFGAKDPDLPLELKVWAAQLAVYNSRARSAGEAVVDYCEKRYLRALKDSVGQLRVTRSETLRVSLDEKFEAWRRSL